MGRELVRYRAFVYDSARWQGFQLRPDDIVISTPPKCGTTWTQMVCVLLVLQTIPLDRRLSTISPWLDMVTRARRDVVADLEAQQHRRVIKTHTPLDGLPLDRSATYLCVGRDPRDVAVSFSHHRDNLDIGAFLTAREAAAAIDGIELEPISPPPPRPDAEIDRFWEWVDDPTPPTQVSSSLRRTLHHMHTFRSAPVDVDVVLLHYDDLQADLGGQMRALADHLGIEVASDRWDDLVAAATFERMRRDADRTTPSAEVKMFRQNAAFFRSGTSGQWRELLDDAGLERYWARVGELAEPELAAWVHRERSHLAY